MKITNYKKGVVVILSDGKHCRYLGEVPVAGAMASAYRPLDGKTKYFAIKDAEGVFVPFSGKVTAEVAAEGEFVPFSGKLAAEVAAEVTAEVTAEEPRKWYQRIGDWWKASNRWKHFLFAIPLGAVCGAPLTTGVGLGMEIKDHLYGGRADFVDSALTAVGGVIGHGVMLAVGLDYLIRFLINLIF